MENQILLLEEDALFKAHVAFDQAYYIDELTSFDALRRAITEYEWSLEQPMDSAPRDGTPIMLYSDDFGWVTGFCDDLAPLSTPWYLYAKEGQYPSGNFKSWRPDLKQPLKKE